MASNLKLADAGNSPPAGRQSAAAMRVMTAVGFGVLLIFALTLLTRRLSGAFSGSFPLWSYACCVLMASALCCGLKLAAEWPSHRLSSRSAWQLGILIGLPLVVIAVALMPTDRTLGGIVLTLIWLTLVEWFCTSTESVPRTRWLATEVIWPEIRDFLFPAEPQRKSQPLSAIQPVVARESLLSLAVETGGDDVTSDAVTGTLISQMERRTLESGAELLEGQLVATFAAGSRQAVLHVPFSPPFSAAPKVECEVVDGADVRIKVGAVFPYGTRLELKRNSPELPALEVAVQVYAECQ